MLLTHKWLNVLIVFMYLKGYSFTNSCDKQTRCQDCIRDSAGCVWCASNNSTIEKRCKLRNTFDNTWCPGELQNPEGLVSSDDKHNLDFRSDPGNIIQIKPQKYSFKVRVGEPINFNFFFKGAKDYPVDLYFLFDASRTMIRVKTEIADKSQKIYETMKNITNDVYLGMGTFVDKNSIPFTGHIDSNMVYSFKHSLKLTTDLNKFKDSVSNILFGQNRDSPEGGLDALAQVIVCKETIGWRNESRKIVVFVTDSPYHAAGDGQPAGITQPYDGKCYTNTVYTKELEMDYPSVSIINKLAAQHDVIILFLIEDKYESLYQDLSRAISGSKVKSYHPNAKSDGSIVDILRDIYQKISKVIKLKTIVKVGNRKNVMVTFDPDCTQINNDKNCGTKSEEEKKFTGTLKILEYDGTDNYTVEIAIEGISEKLTLDIEVISDCECTKEAKKSEFCHDEVRECGICKCGDHRYGDKCACVRNVQNLHNDNITCIAKGSNEMCSNHGTCICGTCSCHEGYEDQYCQCNKDSCPRDTKNNLCSGHGKCRCGTCSCDNGWQGEDCHCPTSTEGCLGLKGVICNNKGTCKCGECKCRDIPEWYKRYDGQDELCNLTPNPQYHMLQCRYLNHCVLSFWNQQVCEEDNVVVNWVEEFIDVHTNSTEWNLCPDIKVDVGCYSSYVYKYNDDVYGIDILVLKHKDCTKNYLIYGITCLGIIVFIGIATIVGWKLLTDARDRKEYLKFKKDHAADLSELCHNPVYAPANVTFTNPTFRKQSISTN